VLTRLGVSPSTGRVYLSGPQQAFANNWLEERGFHADNRCGVVDAEECIAHGIDQNVWTRDSAPSVSGIRSRCKHIAAPKGTSAAKPAYDVD